MTDLEKDLSALVPAPRRTDAAFARAVADGVAKRKSRAFFALPAVAMAAAGFALVAVMNTPAHSGGVDAGVRVADAVIYDDEEDDFALPSLDGSSDEELARLDHALDEAIKQKL